MGCGLAPVAKRLVLKKMTTGVEDVRVQLAALRASNGNREPTYEVALDAVEQLALSYAAEQGTKQSVAFLAGGVGGGKQHAPPPPRGKGGKGKGKVKGQCWGFQKGACTRGSTCIFSHGEQQQNTTQAAQQPAGARAGGQGQRRAYTALIGQSGQTVPLYRRPPYGALRNSDLSSQYYSRGESGARAVMSFATLNPYGLLVDEDPESWTAGPEQPQQQPQQQQQQDAQGQQFAAWLFQMMQGVSHKTGYRVEVLLAVLCLVVKVAMEGQLEERSSTILEASRGILGVVADTGATIRGLGTAYVGLAGNRRFLNNPVLVHTANDITRFYECADLPMEGSMRGAMDGAVVMDHSRESIQPVVPTCEEMDLGFQIAQGGGAARYYKDGQTVQVLRKEGQLFTVPVDGGGCEQWHDSTDGGMVDWGMCGVQEAAQEAAQQQGQGSGGGPAQQGQGSEGGPAQQGQHSGPAHPGQLGEEQQLLHTALVVGTEHSEHTTQYRAFKCVKRQHLQAALALLITTGAAQAQTALVVLKGKQLRQHCLDGHRPYHIGCPWCVRANLR